MASLCKILKSITQLQHLRPINVANIEKYFSCTSLRLEDKVNIDLGVYDVYHNEEIDNVQRAEAIVAFLKGQHDSQLPLHTYQDHTRVYTDASKVGRDCGVGVYCEELQIEEKLRANDKVKYINDGELLGLLAAMKLIHKAEIKGDTRNKKYILMTDNLSALEFMQMPQEGERKRVVEEIVLYDTKLKRRDVNVVFTWIPGHFRLHNVKQAEYLSENAITKEKKEQTRKSSGWTPNVGDKEQTITRIKIPTTETYLKQVNDENNEESGGSGTSEIKINTEDKFSKIHESTVGRPMDRLCQYIELFRNDYGQHATVVTAVQYYKKSAHTGFGIKSERSHLNIAENITGDAHAYSRNVAKVLAMKYALRAVHRQITNGKKDQQLFSPKGNDDKMKVLVLTDSHWGIHELLYYPEQRKDVIEKLKTDLGRLKELNVDVIFSHMPFVWGTPGNDKADELAREAVKVHGVHSLIKDYFKNED